MSDFIIITWYQSLFDTHFDENFLLHFSLKNPFFSIFIFFSHFPFHFFFRSIFYLQWRKYKFVFFSFNLVSFMIFFTLSQIIGRLCPNIKSGALKNMCIIFKTIISIKILNKINNIKNRHVCK